MGGVPTVVRSLLEHPDRDNHDLSSLTSIGQGGAPPSPDTIVRIGKEYADLEEIWRAEKASAQGGAQIKEEIDRLRHQIEELTRKGDFNQVAELQYGKLPELEKRLKEAQAKESRKEAQAPRLLRTQVGAEEIAEVVSRAASELGRVPGK